MSEELKLCPCCEGWAWMPEDKVEGEIYYRATCQCCGIATEWYNTREEAISVWNTRPKQAKNCRYHFDCDDFNHQCSTCKHNDSCVYDCSVCNTDSEVCFYELDDKPQPTLQGIDKLIEMVDARLDHLIDLIKAKKAKVRAIK